MPTDHLTPLEAKELRQRTRQQRLQQLRDGGPEQQLKKIKELLDLKGFAAPGPNTWALLTLLAERLEAERANNEQRT